MRWTNSLWIGVTMLFMHGLSIIIIPFCTTYAMLMSVSCINGFFSPLILLNNVIATDLFGAEKLPISLGYILLFGGFGKLIGSPIAGAIFDATQSYNGSFYLAGVVIFLACVVLGIAALLQRKKTKKENNEVLKNSTVTISTSII